MMKPVIALSDLMDSLLMVGFVIDWIVLLVALVLFLISVVRRSWIAPVVALALLVGSSFLMTPWRAFIPVDDIVDARMISWVFTYRIVATIWILLAILNLMSLFIALRSRKHRKAMMPSKSVAAP
jgi:hypothetical protein